MSTLFACMISTPQKQKWPQSPFSEIEASVTFTTSLSTLSRCRQIDLLVSSFAQCRVIHQEVLRIAVKRPYDRVVEDAELLCLHHEHPVELGTVQTNSLHVFRPPKAVRDPIPRLYADLVPVPFQAEFQNVLPVRIRLVQIDPFPLDVAAKRFRKSSVILKLLNVCVRLDDNQFPSLPSFFGQQKGLPRREVPSSNICSIL